MHDKSLKLPKYLYWLMEKPSVVPKIFWCIPVDTFTCTWVKLKNFRKTFRIWSITIGLKCTFQPSLRYFYKPYSKIWAQYLCAHTASMAWEYVWILHWSLLIATSRFGLLTMKRHKSTRKHLSLNPQGDRSGLRKPKMDKQ